MQLLAVVLIPALIAGVARANELRVDPASVQMNDVVTIMIATEGPFAAADAIHIPLRNLSLIGDPWVSSEFSWVNGQATRRKTFRYRARPMAPGPALVGPVVLASSDGQRDTLRAVAVQVVADRVTGSNDADVVLRGLLAAGRDPLFVIAELPKRAVYVGEPLIVTWWLYNAAVVQEWQVTSVPKLDDFWSEERPRTDSAERVIVGDATMQRLPVRRAVLVPLRSGNLTIAGMSIEAAVMRRSRSGPFAMFEGELAEVTYSSAPVTIDVRPIPPGPAVDAVGDLMLTCDRAVQENGGPVVVRVALSGGGNLRAAKAPHFSEPPPGTLRIEGGEVSVSREEPFSMTRRWRYLIFPSSAGMLEIPPLSLTVFDPTTATRRELRCSSSFVDAVMATPAAGGSPVKGVLPPRTRPWPWITVFLLMLLTGVIAIPRIRRELALRRDVRGIVRDATPHEIRARVEQRVQIGVGEVSDRAEAWRALRSLLDAAERDRDIAIHAEREIARRVRDVLAS